MSICRSNRYHIAIDFCKIGFLGSVLTFGYLSGAVAALAEVAIPGGQAFPESVTSTQDGTLFAGSFANGGIYRATPGATEAEIWIKPGANGSRSTFGVLADEASNTLWVCSNDTSAFGVPGPEGAQGSALITFDLRTGTDKASVKLPGEPTLCNDIAIAADGTVYVTDSFNPYILRLKPGAKAFDVWASDPRFAPPKNGAGLDGIAIGADGNLYVDTYSSNLLFKVAMSDGAPGKVTLLEPSQKITLPDALRRFGPNSFLMVEGGGNLDFVTINNDRAIVKVLQDGFATPVSVAQVGNTAWVAEGQLQYLLNPKLKGEGPKLPFRLYAVPLPQE